MGRKPKHKWTLDEFLDSMRDHMGAILEKASINDLIDLTSFGALAYMAQAPSESNEYKLLHIGMTGLAYRQLTKENSSEAQTLAAGGWILGELTNYVIWLEAHKIIERLGADDRTTHVAARLAKMQGSSL